MPKNKGKGGKNRRRGKNDAVAEKRELEFKEEGQEYAQVLKMLGNGRFDCYCFDGQKRMATIRGKMRKKVWIGVQDIVLVSLRDFQTEAKCDCILKYTPDEARKLKAYGELPENVDVVDGPDFKDDLVTFDDEGGKKSDDSISDSDSDDGKKSDGSGSDKDDIDDI